MDSMGYAGEYEVVELLFEDNNSQPADQDDAGVWTNTFSLDVPVLHAGGQAGSVLVNQAIGYFGTSLNLPAFVVIDPQMRISMFDDGSDFDLVTTVASVSTVPVPAAVWLFGSGLIGLTGISRCKKVALFV